MFTLSFLLIHQENMPAGLLESIDSKTSTFCPGFLKVPLKVDHPHFVVASERDKDIYVPQQSGPMTEVPENA